MEPTPGPLVDTPNPQSEEDGGATVETDYLYPALPILPEQHIVTDKVTVKHKIKVEDPNMITLETPWGYQEVPLYGNFPSPMGELDPINQEHQVDISPDGWKYQDDPSQQGGGGGGG